MEQSRAWCRSETEELLGETR